MHTSLVLKTRNVAEDSDEQVECVVEVKVSREEEAEEEEEEEKEDKEKRRVEWRVKKEQTNGKMRI